jgi:predicted MPP superfamily phosphohydrolase
MTKITVLHVSDLHWSANNDGSLSIVTKALFEDVALMRKEHSVQPDLIIFSGDLAQSGDSEDALMHAFENFLIPLTNAAGLSMDRLFAAPGNHDMSRENVRALPTINTALYTRLKDADAINAFINKAMEGAKEEVLAVDRMSNFYAVHDAYLSSTSQSGPFFRTSKISVNDRTIGVACLNSAWRATGEADDVDYRRLIIGELAIDRALEELEGCDIKVAVHHHPLDWLCPADHETSDARIRSAFNLACSGHMHAARPSFTIDGTGSCVVSQTGSVFAGRKWFNGYQYIEIDLPSGEYTFHVREYHDRDRRFDFATTVCPGGTVTLTDVLPKDPARVDQVELVMRGNRGQIRQLAAEHIDFADFPVSLVDQADDYFVPPPLSKRDTASISDDEEQSVVTEEIKIDEILKNDDNLIFLGSRQSGKSSLCYHIASKISVGEGSKPFIPVYIDARNYKLNAYSIKKAVTNFYGNLPSAFNLEQALTNGLFVFLVDNFSDSDENYLRKFSQHVAEFSANRWLCFGTPDSGGVSKDRVITEYLPDFTKIHIKDLPRRSIRELSLRWSKDSSADAREMFDAVMRQLVRDGLPRTPYMVSLLLWSIHQKKNLEKINEATLLNNIVDHLLGKADFRLAKRGILNPTGKEITLQNMAVYLHEKGGFCTENEVTGFLIEFFDRKKLGYIAADVLTKLVECGILRRDGDNISFKYFCFQEYFMACAMRSSRPLFDHYLGELNFLDVRRELELLAGLRQENSDIIKAISEVLRSRSPTRFNECGIEKFDQIASRELELGTTRSRLNKIKRTRLNDDQVDEMMDEADRRAMARGEKPVTESLADAGGDFVRAAEDRELLAIEADKKETTEPIRPGTHMASIDLLARVIKNSDFTDYDVKGPATRLVLHSWSKIYLVIMDELAAILSAVKDEDGESIPEEELNSVNYIMSKFMFNVTGSAVIRQMSSPVMADTIHEIIKEGDVSTAEYLIILYLLEDINDPNWQNMWSSVIRDKKRSGFVLECFIERLWLLAHTKALDDNQSKRLISVVEEIEKRLDWSNEKKDAMLQNIRNATVLAALKG